MIVDVISACFKELARDRGKKKEEKSVKIPLEFLFVLKKL